MTELPSPAPAAQRLCWDAAGLPLGGPSHPKLTLFLARFSELCRPKRAVGSFPPTRCGIPTRAVEETLPSNLITVLSILIIFFICLAALVILKGRTEVSVPLVPCWAGGLFHA